MEIKDQPAWALLRAHNNNMQTALQKVVLTLGPGLGLSPAPCSGAMADFGDGKVIPGIPGYTEEKDLKTSSAEGLILILFCFFLSKPDTGSYGTYHLSVTCGLMQFTQTHLVLGCK